MKVMQQHDIFLKVIIGVIVKNRKIQPRQVSVFVLLMQLWLSNIHLLRLFMILCVVVANFIACVKTNVLFIIDYRFCCCRYILMETGTLLCHSVCK